MNGRRAALKVAARNAFRNKKRTIFLVLLVAVPVGLGVVAAGITRAGTLTPEERAQREMGSADIRFQARGGEDVVDWVHDNVSQLDPSAQFTDFRQTRVELEDFEFGSASDLDMNNPLTEGMLVLLEGDAPHSPGEAAISPRVAENMDIGIGDRVTFEGLETGELEVVGMVTEPVAGSDERILLWPGALEGAADFTTILVGTENPAPIFQEVDRLWYEEGRQRFWPEPAVDLKPTELAAIEDEIYVFLTASEIEELVSLARSEPEDGFEVVHDRAFEMVYTETGPRPLLTVNVQGDTRDRLMSQGGIEGNPAIVSTAASTILLIEVAFITGAAFAAGTRRRLREIGLLGASGASQKHVRTTVIGEGLTIGLIGSAVGVLLGIVVLFLARPLLHQFVTKLITGLGVGLSDIAGPVLVALAAVLLAAWIPARTASKIPTTTALQGRMPASPPRRWIIPVGLVASTLGLLLITVSIASTSNFSNALVAAGGVMVVGGVALLASPILAGVSKLADHVPAIGRLVLRDSGRHRTRSAVAVATIMVILLAPAIFVTMAETSEQQELLRGLPAPSNHLLLSGSYEAGGFQEAPITKDDVESVAAVVPDRQSAVFATLNVRARTEEQMEIEEMSEEMTSTIRYGSEGNSVAVANDDLVKVLGDERVGKAIDQGRIVVLGVENEETTVSVDYEERPAVELPIPVARSTMPRVLLPPSMADQYENAESRQMALLILERQLTDEESSELSALSLRMIGGLDSMNRATAYMIGTAVTLAAVLIVIALVTAVSAAEVDEELRSIVAVGAPGSFRRRFLGLLTGYQTLVGAALAVPLGLGLIKAFTSARDTYYLGTFGRLNGSTMFIPWGWLIALVVVTPVVVGLLTWISVRSAPVTPPRRAT